MTTHSDAGILGLPPGRRGVGESGSAPGQDESIGSFLKIGALAGTIEELGEKTVKCDRHAEYQSSGRRYLSTKSQREFWTPCPWCVQEEDLARDKERREAEAADALARQERLMQRTFLPARFRGKTFENFDISGDSQDAKHAALYACRSYATNFDVVSRRGDSLVFVGGSGTGKNHMASAILQAILPRYVGMYMTILDMIRMIRETWRKSSPRSETEVLNELGSLPLLVIDEIGVQYASDGEQTILFDVIDRRYRDRKPTIMITNLDQEEFKTLVGPRIYDRLTETAKWVVFDWPSYRPVARQELKRADF